MSINEELNRKINRHIEETQSDKPRTHLGFSVLGKRCVRQVWYGFRWVYHVRHMGRMLRLFQRGHGEETRMAAHLRAIGFKLDLVNPETKRQFLASFFSGHVGGSSDGRIEPNDDLVPGMEGQGLFECKTHGDKSFKKLVKEGLILSKPEHYTQMQMYMGSQGLTWGLYCAVNKNDDELHFELVVFKPEVYAMYLDRGSAVVFARTPPPRFTSDSSHFECKFCDYRETCWKDRPYAKSCRSCAFAEAVIEEGNENADWYCHKHGGVLPKSFIPKGCDDWEPAV